jgi:transposase-like protein
MDRQPQRTGVYRIRTPSVNELVYIGSAARCLTRRWVVHRSALSNGVHHSPHLQEVVDKYGLNVLQFDIVELCSPTDCLRREQFWMDQYPSEKRYNINPRAESRLGSKFTPAQYQKLIESHGGVVSAALRAQIVTEYLQGAKLTVLAKKYKVTRGTIRNYVCRSGTAIRPLPTRNEALRVKIVEAYAAGRGVKHLAKIHCLDYDTVMRILTRAGTPMRSRSARQRLRFQDIEGRKRLSMTHGGKIYRFVHRTHGLFVGYAVELARQFGLSVHNINAVARGTRPAHKGWEICTGEPHVWKKPEHRQYPRGAEHPMANKIFDLEWRRAMARRLRRCSDSQILEIRRLLQSDAPQSQIAKRFGVTQSVISRINTGARHYAEFR